MNVEFLDVYVYGFVFMVSLMLIVFLVVDHNTTLTEKKVRALKRLYNKGISVYKVAYCGDKYHTFTNVRRYDETDPEYDTIRLDRISLHIKDYEITSRKNIVSIDIPKEIKRIISKEKKEKEEEELKKQKLIEDNLNIREKRKREGLVY